MEENRKSALVTAVATVLIICSSVVTLLTGAIFGAFHMVLAVDGKELSVVAAEAGQSGDFGPYIGFLLEHVELFIVGSFFVCSLWLVVSIGLLRRKNWARIGSIIFILLIVLLSVAGLIFLPVVVASIPANPGGAEVSGQDSVDNLTTVFNTLHTLAICALCVGIAWKLRTEAIVKEFA